MITSAVFSQESQSKYRRVKDLCKKFIEKYGLEGITYVTLSLDESVELIKAIEDYVNSLPEEFKKDVAICLPGDLPEKCVPHGELVNKIKTDVNYLKSIIKYFGSI